MTQHRILALDCATKTGWAIIGSDGKVIESGVQDFSKKRGESNGLMFLRFNKWMREVCEMSSPTIICYEQAHHRGGAATEICVNITGRVQEVAAMLEIECSTVRTTTLKKFATGKGNADKAEMIAKARTYLDREPIDDNEADAIHIGMWAYEQYC